MVKTVSKTTVSLLKLKFPLEKFTVFLQLVRFDAASAEINKKKEKISRFINCVVAKVNAKSVRLF